MVEKDYFIDLIQFLQQENAPLFLAGLQTGKKSNDEILIVLILPGVKSWLMRGIFVMVAEQGLVGRQKINEQEVAIYMEPDLVRKLIYHVDVLLRLKSHERISAPSVFEVGLNLLLKFYIDWLHIIKTCNRSEKFRKVIAIL